MPLNKLRKRIDEIDHELVKLLNERAQVVVDIGKLKNKTGTVAMARTADVNSATAQFFINTADNRDLDHGGLKPELYGYAVFGEVVDGMDVVYTIEQTATTSTDDYDDVPEDPIIIEAVTVID